MHDPEKVKIIVALDVNTPAEALQLTDALAKEADAFKVGLQLFLREGPDIVRKLKARGVHIFLDLKFHDIPNTVAQAVSSACALNVDLITVHLLGGPRILEAAARAAEGSSTLLLGVSVLTSTNAIDLATIGFRTTVEEQVLRLAELAAKYLGGIVASPLEITPLKNRFGNSLQIVTPGVRPTWAANNDQERILTPVEAANLGANWLVIGRPITAAKSPVQALLRIKKELTIASNNQRKPL